MEILLKFIATEKKINRELFGKPTNSFSILQFELEVDCHLDTNYMYTSYSHCCIKSKKYGLILNP